MKKVYFVTTARNILIKYLECIGVVYDVIQSNIWFDDYVVSATLTMEKANDYYDNSNQDTSIRPTWVIQSSDNSIIYIDAENNEDLRDLKDINHEIYEDYKTLIDNLKTIIKLAKQLI